MVVSIYDQGGGTYTFREPSDGQARGVVRVSVPAGSQILETKGFGIDLFVPMGRGRQRVAWTASGVMREATRKRGRFRLM